MLKIQRLPHGDSVVLAVCGRLDGEAIGELRWALEGEAGRTVVVEHCPEYVRQWIDAEAE